MADPITVLLVDDHSMVRLGLRAFFSTLADIEVVAEAATGVQAVSLAQQHAPDVVLMDLMLPGMDGVQATQQVKKASPRTQVIVLTSYHEDEHIFPAIRAGALSYVLKDIDPDDLAEARATRKSPPRSSSARRLSRVTSPTSSASSTWPTAPRRRCLRGSRGL
jgi:NarL family two-component system response regulator LiaR